MKPIPKYATFNRRMWASTFDSIIAYFTLDPLVTYLLAKTGKPAAAAPELDIQALANLNFDSGIDPALLKSSLGGGLGEYLWDTTIEWTVQTIVFLLVIAIFWKLWSASPGKMICKIAVVDADDEMPISDQQILLRCLGYIVACAPLFLGILWIGMDKRRQGWHDKIANTVVIHTEYEG